MLPEPIINEKVDALVKAYTDEIVEIIREHKGFDFDITVEYHEALNSNETEKAFVSTIITDFGMVSVFPDFKTTNSQAAVLRVGTVTAMQKEGFDDDYIFSEGAVYGTLLPYTKENAELFGTYLSMKISTE